MVEGQAALHKLVLGESKDGVVRPTGGALGEDMCYQEQLMLGESKDRELGPAGRNRQGETMSSRVEHCGQGKGQQGDAAGSSDCEGAMGVRA